MHDNLFVLFHRTSSDRPFSEFFVVKANEENDKIVERVLVLQEEGEVSSPPFNHSSYLLLNRKTQKTVCLKKFDGIKRTKHHTSWLELSVWFIQLSIYFLYIYIYIYRERERFSNGVSYYFVLRIAFISSVVFIYIYIYIYDKK